jgi:hypothetical protein
MGCLRIDVLSACKTIARGQKDRRCYCLEGTPLPTCKGWYREEPDTKQVALPTICLDTYSPSAFVRVQ